MWPFGRRRRGRHALGAAVLDLPSAPPSLAGSIAALIASGEAWADQGVRPAAAGPRPALLPDPVPAVPLAALRLELPAVASPLPVVAVGRVQLVFRDGSTAVLDPDQAAALEELAGLLTSRD